ncbi:hypothetical protein Agub_g13446 [Astrephomene gubernaculifera]|uniref:Uncharacterized protein n=1 Tax=Astrephomene gubernaculifera TaxID=47775 RepID=A0AAD3HSF2_9CHLO|nr:hypothetical protein Agub_g13446 [Astrephomene gubernaculifera]
MLALQHMVVDARWAVRRRSPLHAMKDRSVYAALTSLTARLLLGFTLLQAHRYHATCTAVFVPPARYPWRCMHLRRCVGPHTGRFLHHPPPPLMNSQLPLPPASSTRLPHPPPSPTSCLDSSPYISSLLSTPADLPHAAGPLEGTKQGGAGHCSDLIGSPTWRFSLLPRPLTCRMPLGPCWKAPSRAAPATVLT